jgi:DNA-binding beta-propeller fold protein YncE
MDPLGEYLVSTDGLLRQVQVHRLDPESGSLELVQVYEGEVDAPLTGPTDLSFSPDGADLYVLDSTLRGIFVLELDGASD